MAVACKVSHRTRGRVRLRVPLTRPYRRLAESLETFLLDQPGIRAVRVNRNCCSVIVDFDPNQWSADGVADLVRRQSREGLILYRPKNLPVNGRPSADAIHPLATTLLSSAAVLGSWMFRSWASPAVPWLVALSSLPTLSRASTALFRKGRLNVDVLDASAIGTLMVRRSYPATACMVWLINVADWIRDSTMARSRRAISDVWNHRARLAWVVRNGQKVRVPADQILVGEIAAVYSGERIPVDGTVVDGKAAVDQQALTGESQPVNKEAGDTVYAATVVRDGKLYVRADKTGDETEAARILHLVESVPSRDTRVQNHAERLADDIVPYSFLGAGIAAVLARDPTRAASLMIIDFGTGIRVAAPTTVLASMSKAARRGILFKGGRFLELLAQVDALVFDKTGTLTSGCPEVVEVISYSSSFSEDRVLAIAAAAEVRLSHPVALAVVRAAELRGLDVPQRTQSEYSIGHGMEAVVEGLSVLVGHRRFVESNGIFIPPAAEQDIERMEKEAASPLLVCVNDSVVGLLGIRDPLREEAPKVIAALRQRGVRKIVILTGDNPGVAERVAEELGVSTFEAELFPERKVEFVKDLQRAGYCVGVVGDGINDSPALAQADVGIAVAGGTDVAQAAAQVVLMRGDLWKVPLAIDIAREATGLIEQNWRLIAVPNAIALGMSVAGLLGPVGATIVSNGSALLAAANALRPMLSSSAKPAFK